MCLHPGAIVKACYNPKIMRSVGGADEATCIALGSQDTKLTVWLSNSKRPTFVAHKLFKQSVVDLAWTPDGYSLLACSTDGTLAVLQFEPKELGVPLNQVQWLFLCNYALSCCTWPHPAKIGFVEHGEGIIFWIMK